jgi:hypothetical protein
MKLTADCLFWCSSRAKKLAVPVLVLGAVATAGLGWVTTAEFHSNWAATLAAGDPAATGSPPSASEAVGRPGRNDDTAASDAAPEQTQGAWLERWWMAVQESVKYAE